MSVLRTGVSVLNWNGDQGVRERKSCVIARCGYVNASTVERCAPCKIMISNYSQCLLNVVVRRIEFEAASNNGDQRTQSDALNKNRLVGRIRKSEEILGSSFPFYNVKWALH